MANNLGIPEVTLTEIIATGAAIAAQGTLTLAAQVTADDTMTVGDITYTFLAGATAAEGTIGIGADLPACKLAVVAAINGTDGYNVNNPAVVIADFIVNDAILTAEVWGTEGNSVVTTSVFTTGTNLFDAVTLGTTTAGVDGINTINTGGRTSALEPLVVRVMGHDADSAAEEDDPDLMALFTSKAQGHPWVKENNCLARITFAAADGTTPAGSDSTYIVPFFDYSTY